jgi:hypothetical protein
MPDIADLLLLARLCNLAYVDSEPVRVKAVDALGATYVAAYQDADHRAFTCKHGAENLLVLCGTRFSDGNWRELFDDSDLLPVSQPGGVRVMQGFYRGLTEMWVWARDHVDGPLTITGHSLGGARAHLMPEVMNVERIARIVSFGAPKAADALYWKDFPSPLTRVVHARDFAPGWPIISEYSQPSPFLWLAGGQIMQADESKWFGDSLADHSIQDGYVKALEALTPAA